MYKIYGILLGEKDTETRRLLPEVQGVKPIIPTAYYMWCLKGNEDVILVDTGLKDEDVAIRKLYNVRNPADQLRKIDVEPSNVRSVVVTHLHSDHFSAFHLYPNAIFYVQRIEVEFFTGPAVRFRQIVRRASDAAEVVKLAYQRRIRYLDGNEQVFPGIRVVLVGGHTPGSQVVVVKTRRGEVVLCSDALDLYQNMEEEVVPQMVNLAQGLLALDKIKNLASSPELVIPGHDSLVMSKFPNPVEGVVEIG